MSMLHQGRFALYQESLAFLFQGCLFMLCREAIIVGRYSSRK